MNRKLSSVLDASPLKHSYIGKIIHDRYQNHLQKPDGSLTLASILNETLSKLKERKPNKAFLKPLKLESESFNNQEDDSRYVNMSPIDDSYTPKVDIRKNHNF